MTRVRRAVLSGVLVVALLGCAAGAWWEWGETGREHRYREELASYCDGLLPYAESRALTGLRADSLSDDSERSSGKNRHQVCRIANSAISITRFADGSEPTEDAERHSLGLGSARTWHPPAEPLGGGWHGATNFTTTAVVLDCADGPAALVVSVEDFGHGGRPAAQRAADLVTATAAEAAERWSCRAELGGKVPSLAAPAEQLIPSSADGTCKGVPDAWENEMRPGRDEIHWMKEARATGTAPVERCVLGETRAWDAALYVLQASYGPYARNMDESAPGANSPQAGFDQHFAWASAACPGSPLRAFYWISATVFAYPEKPALLKALRAFAGGSAERHSCTDLRLPR